MVKYNRSKIEMCYLVLCRNMASQVCFLSECCVAKAAGEVSLLRVYHMVTIKIPLLGGLDRHMKIDIQDDPRARLVCIGRCTLHGYANQDN